MDHNEAVVVERLAKLEQRVLNLSCAVGYLTGCLVGELGVETTHRVMEMMTPDSRSGLMDAIGNATRTAEYAGRTVGKPL